MKHLQKAYGDLHLQAKLMLTLFLSVGIPLLLLGFALAPRLVRMNISQTIRNAQDHSALAMPELESVLQEISSLADEVEKLPFYATLFHKPLEAPLASLLSEKEAQSFSEEVQALKDQSPASHVRLYFSDACLGEVPSLFQEEHVITGTYWHGILSAKNRRDLYCPPAYLGPKERSAMGELLYLRPTTYYQEGEAHRAYLAIYFPAKVLTDLLSSRIDLPGSVTYIVNERDEIAATTKASLSGIYFLSYSTVEKTSISFNHFVSRTVLGEKVYAGYFQLEEPGWILVTVLPEKELFLKAGLNSLPFFLCIAITLVLASFLFSILSRSLTLRIKELSKQMQKAKASLPSPLPAPLYQDEVGDLLDAYNYMASQINQLMKEQAKAADDLRIAEFRSLQAQMNPHFLYNAMDMIHWMAKQGQTEQISETVKSLSRFYRLTLSNKKELWSIEEEVEHACLYLEIQNMRFGNRITYVVDVPDELYAHQIPKLTLQPVVENAILHGLLETKEKGGTIVLTGWQEGEDVVLLVSDDGAGMEKERLEVLLTGQGESSSGGTNIAVYNTHRRLQLLYGSSYGLSYKSAPGEGCEVTIRFPLT